ncbi:MAG: transcriptional repressor [Firmicutes bacterium]|jgi:Fe2+ or Zn2+ uptake regulation protein|nr:transcriptional repressor [Bacillota bacterium]
MKIVIDNVGEYLKSHNIKPSYQRIRIFEYLINTTSHPTVDEIYKVLISEIPTLSKTTVYNTLNLFVENEIAKLLTIEENEARYDANTGIHGHFKCDGCGEVMDFDFDFTKLGVSELDGFQVKQQDVFFRGMCKSCSGKTKN